MQTVPRMADLLKEFLLKLHRRSLRGSISQRAQAVLYANITGCKIMRRARLWRASSRSLCAVQWLGYDAKPRSRIQRLSV